MNFDEPAYQNESHLLMDVLLIKQTVLSRFELSLSLNHPFLTVLSEFRNSLWVLGVHLIDWKNHLVRLSLHI